MDENYDFKDLVRGLQVRQAYCTLRKLATGDQIRQPELKEILEQVERQTDTFRRLPLVELLTRLQFYEARVKKFKEMVNQEAAGFARDVARWRGKELPQSMSCTFLENYHNYRRAFAFKKLLEKVLDEWEPPPGVPRSMEGEVEQGSRVAKRQKSDYRKPLKEALSEIRTSIKEKEISPKEACQVFLLKNELHGKPGYPVHKLLNYYYRQYPQGGTRKKRRTPSHMNSGD